LAQTNRIVDVCLFITTFWIKEKRGRKIDKNLKKTKISFREKNKKPQNTRKKKENQK
jgi:hypothetical protein